MCFPVRVIAMPKAIACLVSVVVLSSAGLMATTMQQPPADNRAQAKKFYEENNFNDSLKLYRELALDAANTGNELPDDLGFAVVCLNNLGLVNDAHASGVASVTLNALTEFSKFTFTEGGGQPETRTLKNGVCSGKTVNCRRDKCNGFVVPES